MTRFLPGSIKNRAETDHGPVLRQIAMVCRAAAQGDLEPRATMAGDPMAEEAREALNNLLDVIDAYVRESTAAIQASSEGRFFRRLLPGGLKGAFRRGALSIETGRLGMRDAAGRVLQATQARKELAESLETTVLTVSEQVAAAATQIGATAEGVVSFAGAAVTDAQTATGTVTSLRASSEEIRKAVNLITQIASQTRLLALNATIEAARAGDAGRGFSVVADEVKALADEVAHSSDAIIDAVQSVQTSAEQAIAALNGVTGRVREMDSMVNDIAAAVDGGARGGAAHGLVGLAGLMRSEVSAFVDEIRQG